MTAEQREDLLVEWDITSTRIKNQIITEYHQQFGNTQPIEHWELFLIDALNLQQSWRARGLL